MAGSQCTRLALYGWDQMSMRFILGFVIGAMIGAAVASAVSSQTGSVSEQLPDDAVSA